MARTTEFWVEVGMQELKKLTKNRAHSHPEVMLTNQLLLQLSLRLIRQEDESLQSMGDIKGDGLEVAFHSC